MSRLASRAMKEGVKKRVKRDQKGGGNGVEQREK